MTTPEARVSELLADPRQTVARLGEQVRPGEATLQFLDIISDVASALRRVNDEILPLMNDMSDAGSRSALQRWWDWFSGAELERDLMFGRICERVQTLAIEGQERAGQLAGTIAALRQENERLAADMAALQTDIAAAASLIASPDAQAALVAAAGPEEPDRLARKHANLETLAAALRLTATQYAVAIDHARQLQDRFDEIKTILVPLWYQRLGMDIFIRRLDADDATAPA